MDHGQSSTAAYERASLGLDNVAEDKPPRASVHGTGDDAGLADTLLASGESTADDTSPRECTRNQAAFNLFLYMFGATQIPYAIGQMGWYWGAFFMASMSVSSYHSGYLLSDICVRRKLHSWPAIGQYAFGRTGMLAIELLQTVNFFLSGIVQTQGAGSQ